MARTRTLPQFRSAIRWRADIEGLTLRHTDAALNTEINASWQRLRELVSDNGDEYFLKQTTGQTAAGAVAGASFGTIDFPSDAARIYGVDVSVNGDIVDLEPISFTQRNEFQLPNGGTGIPQAYHVYNVGSEFSSLITTGKIAVYPAPDTGYSYSIWYLPVWTDITDDTYVFNVMSGWDEWVVLDVAIKVVTRDNDSMGAMAALEAKWQQANEALARRAPKLSRGGPKRRYDARGMRRSRRVRFNDYLER